MCLGKWQTESNVFQVRPIPYALYSTLVHVIALQRGARFCIEAERLLYSLCAHVCPFVRKIS